MESEGSSNPKNRHSRRATHSGIVIREGNVGASNVPTNADATHLNPQQISFKRDPSQYIPVANVVRIMRRILPAHAKIADDAKETIQECVSEFICLVTNEANEKCHREYRKTITPEDVLAAMRALQFDNYIEPLSIFLNKHRAQDSGHYDSSQQPFDRRVTSFVLQRSAVQVPKTAPPPPPPMGALPANDFELSQAKEFHADNEGGGRGSSSASSAGHADPSCQFK